MSDTCQIFANHLIYLGPFRSSDHPTAKVTGRSRSDSGRHRCERPGPGVGQLPRNVWRSIRSETECLMTNDIILLSFWHIFDIILTHFWHHFDTFWHMKVVLLTTLKNHSISSLFPGAATFRTTTATQGTATQGTASQERPATTTSGISATRSTTSTTSGSGCKASTSTTESQSAGSAACAGAAGSGGPWKNWKWEDGGSGGSGPQPSHAHQWSQWSQRTQWHQWCKAQDGEDKGVQSDQGVQGAQDDQDVAQVEGPSKEDPYGCRCRLAVCRSK